MWEKIKGWFSLIAFAAIVLFFLAIEFVPMILPLLGNRQTFDTVYKFDTAIVELANGEIVQGDVDSWKDYAGDQLQVEIDGVTYLVHAKNVTLIAE